MIEINPMPPVMDGALHKKLGATDVATLGHSSFDANSGMGFAPRDIQALHHDKTIAGRVVTLSLLGRDSGLLHHAIGLCRPGDVLVIKMQCQDYACLGGGVAFAAHARGIAGAVIDGPATDRLELTELGFPVWCRGVSPITTQSIGEQGTMNMPVTIGGVTVRSGDVAFADCSGVVFLRSDQAHHWADIGVERSAKGGRRRGEILNGAIFGELTGASERVFRHLKSSQDKAS